MATPAYFHFYDMPEFDVRYGTDPVLTRRCDAVAFSLYQLLAQEVKFLRTVPADCMDGTLWDLCYCTGAMVDGIPFDELTVEASCEREAPQLFKLARRFVEYNVTGQAAHVRLESLTQYVVRKENTESPLEAVS